MCQGDMTISEYSGHPKKLANNLHDIGQPGNEDNQILNMLRGLNPKFNHAISSITSKHSLPAFLQARSFLRMEEIREDEKAKAQTARLSMKHEARILLVLDSLKSRINLCSMNKPTDLELALTHVSRAHR